MADVKEAFGSNGICAICKRNPVTRWCDYVVSYDTTTTFLRNYKDFVSVNGAKDYDTCDLPMCEKCATNVGRERDLCPHHMSLHRKVQLPDEYQRHRQRQERHRIHQAGDEQ